MGSIFSKKLKNVVLNYFFPILYFIFIAWGFVMSQ